MQTPRRSNHPTGWKKEQDMDEIINHAIAWLIVIAASALATWVLGVTGVFDYIEKLYL